MPIPLLHSGKLHIPHRGILMKWAENADTKKTIKLFLIQNFFPQNNILHSGLVSINSGSVLSCSGWSKSWGGSFPRQILRPPRDSGAHRSKSKNHGPRPGHLTYKGELWAQRGVRGACPESQNKLVLEPKPEIKFALTFHREIYSLCLWSLSRIYIESDNHVYQIEPSDLVHLI